MFILGENLVRKYHLSGVKFGLAQRTNNLKRNWIFTTNLNFPIPLSLQPDDLNLDISNFSDFKTEPSD